MWENFCIACPTIESKRASMIIAWMAPMSKTVGRAPNIYRSNAIENCYVCWNSFVYANDALMTVKLLTLIIFCSWRVKKGFVGGEESSLGYRRNRWPSRFIATELLICHDARDPRSIPNAHSAHFICCWLRYTRVSCMPVCVCVSVWQWWPYYVSNAMGGNLC